MASRHVSLRIPDETFRRIETRRRETGQPRSKVILTLLEERLRMEEHRGIEFRLGYIERHAALIGGPKVWVIASVYRDVKARDEEDRIERTAKLTGYSPEQVRIAARYYLQYRDEMDEWLRETEEEATRARAAWRRERGLPV